MVEVHQELAKTTREAKEIVEVYKRTIKVSEQMHKEWSAVNQAKSGINDSVLRIKLKCGLVCELTLRVNRHSNGQESPLFHHYVF